MKKDIEPDTSETIQQPTISLQFYEKILKIIKTNEFTTSKDIICHMFSILQNNNNYNIIPILLQTLQNETQKLPSAQEIIQKNHLARQKNNSDTYKDNCCNVLGKDIDIIQQYSDNSSDNNQNIMLKPILYVSTTLYRISNLLQNLHQNRHHLFHIKYQVISKNQYIGSLHQRKNNYTAYLKELKKIETIMKKLKTFTYKNGQYQPDFHSLLQIYCNEQQPYNFFQKTILNFTIKALIFSIDQDRKVYINLDTKQKIFLYKFIQYYFKQHRNYYLHIQCHKLIMMLKILLFNKINQINIMQHIMQQFMKYIMQLKYIKHSDYLQACSIMQYNQYTNKTIQMIYQMKQQYLQFSLKEFNHICEERVLLIVDIKNIWIIIQNYQWFFQHIKYKTGIQIDLYPLIIKSFMYSYLNPFLESAAVHEKYHFIRIWCRHSSLYQYFTNTITKQKQSSISQKWFKLQQNIIDTLIHNQTYYNTHLKKIELEQYYHQWELLHQFFKNKMSEQLFKSIHRLWNQLTVEYIFRQKISKYDQITQKVKQQLENKMRIIEIEQFIETEIKKYNKSILSEEIFEILYSKLMSIHLRSKRKKFLKQIANLLSSKQHNIWSQCEKIQKQTYKQLIKKI